MTEAKIGRIDESSMKVTPEWTGACSSPVLDAVEHGVPQPLVDSGFAPSHAPAGDADLPGEGPGRHLAVEGRAAEAGAIKHRVEAEDTVGRLSGHGKILYRAMDFERT